MSKARDIIEGISIPGYGEESTELEFSGAGIEIDLFYDPDQYISVLPVKSSPEFVRRNKEKVKRTLEDSAWERASIADMKLISNTLDFDVSKVFLAKLSHGYNHVFRVFTQNGNWNWPASFSNPSNPEISKFDWVEV